MALIIADRVLETSTTIGTGAYTLAGAVTGYRAASAVCANGDTFYYYAEDVNTAGVPNGGWECGLGTWNTGATLTRTTILTSSNANAAVSWAAGTRRIALGIISTLFNSKANLASPTFTGTVTSTNDIVVSSATASTTTATGAITVAGGIGVVGNVVTTQVHTPTGLANRPNTNYDVTGTYGHFSGVNIGRVAGGNLSFGDGNTPASITGVPGASGYIRAYLNNNSTNNQLYYGNTTGLLIGNGTNPATTLDVRGSFNVTGDLNNSITLTAGGSASATAAGTVTINGTQPTQPGLAGGAINITAGQGASATVGGTGGAVNITGGASGANATNGGGGAVVITGGIGNTLNAGVAPGAVTIAAGAAQIAGQAGASVNISASDAFSAATTAPGGNVTITAGNGVFSSGNNGKITLNALGGGGGTAAAVVTNVNSGTGEVIWQRSGTNQLKLTSAGLIPQITNSYTLGSTSLAWNGLYTTSINNGPIAGFRNRVINGNMVIDQRNLGGSVSAATTNALVYVVDRFGYYVSQASKFSVQQNAGSVTPPAGSTNYLGVTVTTAYTSLLSSDLFLIEHRIEGVNSADLNWGTANAKAVTLSFKVYSSLTGTFGGSVNAASGSYSYPFSYSIPVANTWTTITIQIPGPTAGTWLSTIGSCIQINFSLGSGTIQSGTAGSWTASSLFSTTGAVSVVGTLSATWYVTAVQLEIGSSATPFENRTYPVELALCQRYYYKSPAAESLGLTFNGTYPFMSYIYPVPMRTTPTISGSYTVSSGLAGTLSVYATTGGLAGNRTALLTNSAANWTTNAAVAVSVVLDAEI